MKIPFLKKLEKIGDTIKEDCYIEEKTGMPNHFNVPNVKIPKVRPISKSIKFNLRTK